MSEAPKRFNPRAVIGGAFAGAIALCVAVAALMLLLPPQEEQDYALDYGYVYSGAKAESVAFTTAGMDDHTYLLFGSSELSTPKDVVAQVPSAIFGQNAYPVKLACIGEAYDQSLWQAIAVGAYGATDVSRRIAIIVSPTWFENDGLSSETFQLKFSYPLYRAFCDNSQVSASTKSYVAKRLQEQGISETVVEAGEGDSLSAAINNAAFSFADDLRLRADLAEVRKNGIPRIGDATEEPDFEALAWDAQVEALVESTNNAWGMDDAFYEANLAGREEALRGTQSDEHFNNGAEYQDFAVLLKVCREVGFEPLVIISPVHGEFYDLVGTDPADRERCYERIRALCEENDVSVADFSDKEYENYFLHDIVHFGWTGWVAAEEAIYHHVSAE